MQTLTLADFDAALREFYREDAVFELRLHPLSWHRFVELMLTVAKGEPTQGLPIFFGLLPVFEDKDIPEGEVRAIWRSGKVDTYSLERSER